MLSDCPLPIGTAGWGFSQEKKTTSEANQIKASDVFSSLAQTVIK